MTSPDQIARLRELGAATVYEAQGAFGALDSGIKPIDGTSRVAGPAVTVDARPADNLILHHAVLQAQPGDVLVVDAKGFVEAGPWGDVLTVLAQKRGIAGLIINGAVRDANTIIDLGFPVFCRGLSIKSTGKQQSGRVNVPICIGDTPIQPGDIIVGDRDGVCVVPRNGVERAIAMSEQREAKEEVMRRAIEQGANTVELMNLGETLKRLGIV